MLPYRLSNNRLSAPIGIYNTVLLFNFLNGTQVKDTYYSPCLEEVNNGVFRSQESAFSKKTHQPSASHQKKPIQTTAKVQNNGRQNPFSSSLRIYKAKFFAPSLVVGSLGKIKNLQFEIMKFPQILYCMFWASASNHPARGVFVQSSWRRLDCLAMMS